MKTEEEREQFLKCVPLCHEILRQLIS
jgi:hypothetical protein